MVRLSNVQVDIFLKDEKISGIMNGTHEGWSFHSDNYYFLELFPAGVLYSFSHYGPGVLYSQMMFQEAAARKVKELIIEHCFLRPMELQISQ